MPVFSLICCNFAEIFLKQMNKYFSVYILIVALVAMNLVSCNKKDEPSSNTSDYSVYSSATTLVTKFSLKANTKIMNHLDSVKFAIDQEKGIIYNADSLPRGTRVSALLVDLSCASTVATRQFIVKNGNVQKDTIINYTASSTDSIDFTGDVTLRITARDGIHQRDYKVKVNVHKQDPDVIVWEPTRRRDLPSDNGNISESKTVRQGDSFMCLVKDGTSYVLSMTEDPMSGSWDKSLLALPFEPEISSFTATESAIYMLDENGELFSSEDKGDHWTDCGVAWHTIIGSYYDKVLGIKKESSLWMHDEYPQSAGFQIVDIDPSFPIEGMSQLVMANNSWSSDQQAMFAGGVLANGNLTNTVWGYDGSKWGMLSGSGDANVLPKLRDAALVPYFTYTIPSGHITPQRHVTWMVIGGVLNDGSLNIITYTSNSQGLYWNTGVDGVQMPLHVPAFYGAQAYCMARTINASSSMLHSYNPGQTTAITQWECPYIYLFGGYAGNGNALVNLWEGVLLRLTYKPIF